MNDALNRRVAVDVMGEKEPTQPPRTKTWGGEEHSFCWGNAVMVDKPNAGWLIAMTGLADQWEWRVRDFSGDMNLAMKAAAKVLERLPNSKLEVWVDESGYWNACIPYCEGVKGRSKSPAEAICHLLTSHATLDLFTRTRLQAATRGGEA